MITPPGDALKESDREILRYEPKDSARASMLLSDCVVFL